MQICKKSVAIILPAAIGIASASPALAGKEANFILYNQHMEEKGVKEIEVYSDYAHVGKGEPNYTAQLLEIEYSVTDLWTTALYLEGAKTFEEGANYDFASFRFENRFRLFKQETLLNPVLYFEYEQKKPESRFILSVVGRTDTPEGPKETEHELETRLIVGHDISSRLNVAFNTIQEFKFDNGGWSFGYAAGLNYAILKTSDHASEQTEATEAGNWGLEKLTLGLEAYGGLGDSVRGLTLDPGKTQQYIGVNFRAEFKNEVHVGIGGAFGLTGGSEDAILRLTAGYEFK